MKLFFKKYIFMLCPPPPPYSPSLYGSDYTLVLSARKKSCANEINSWSSQFGANHGTVTFIWSQSWNCYIHLKPIIELLHSFGANHGTVTFIWSQSLNCYFHLKQIMELLHSFGANHGTVTFISPAITYRITTGVFELYQKNKNNSKFFF